MSYSQALLHYKGFHAIQVWMASAACWSALRCLLPNVRPCHPGTTC